MIITLDGPSGTGKTTVARQVANRLGFAYFDTGAMYRAVTWSILKHNIPLSDEQAIKEHLDEFTFRIEENRGNKKYFVHQEEVTEAIRSPKITKAVSEVSALPLVREKLWKVQRDFARKESAVFEGRDMGSVVFPDAEVKIFLTADPKIRARRRLEEFKRTRPDEAHEYDEQKMIQDIQRRDHIDSTRELAPLVCPEGAYKIDTSHLSVDEIVEKILKREQKILKKMGCGWLYCKEMKPFYRFILACAWMTYKVLYQHKIYGLEHYHRGAGILAANHVSYLDPPIVAISWPEEVQFLAKESLFRPFLFGRLIRALNSHPVTGEVGDISVFKTLIQLLKEGKKIILFPEGGRTETGELQPLKPGIGLLVAKGNAAVIPTYIHGAYEIWNIHRKFPKFRGKTACVFGKPLLWENFSHLDKKEAQAQMTAALAESIQKLKSWY